MLIRPDNAQHIGAREQQEDSFGFSSFDQTEIIHNRGFAAVLADGMGGMTHGREVSGLAVQSFLRYYQDLSIEEDIPNLMRNSLLFANNEVQRFAEKQGLKNQVGSTLIAATVINSNLYWISVGDSRIYLFRQNELIQLTEDHIYAKVLNVEAAMGKITKEDVENHPQKGALTSFLGLEELTEIDQNFIPFPLYVGDRVLLCSDGVYGFIDEDEISKVLSDVQDETCEMLIIKVLEKKHLYQDNITAVLLDFIKGSQTERQEKIQKPTTKKLENQPFNTHAPAPASPTKEKSKLLPFFIPFLLAIMLIMGGLACYLFIVKDVTLSDVKTKITNLLPQKEKQPKEPKEGDKKE
jgi:PPM family protein phosphatase